MTTLDDATILAKLRSTDPADRSAALSALYNYPVMLIATKDGQISMAASILRPDTSLFTALLWASARMGAAFGMQLNWVHDARENDKKLLIPGPGSGLMR